MKIQTNTRSIDIQNPSASLIKRLQDILPYGLIPLDPPVNRANYGLVFQCGDQEVYALKQQPMELERTAAERLFHRHHLMIMDTYCRYIRLGLTGAYLATPYLRERENGLWESGLAHIIFPAAYEVIPSGRSFDQAYDQHLGVGATRMFIAFVEQFKQALSHGQFTMPQYLGIDIRSRSHLQNLAMYFMVLDSEIICLRSNLRAKEDRAWDILAQGGISQVVHIPALPMGIKESHLDRAKGRI